jgi:uncharacterized protein (TIGR03000 family)
MPYQAGYYGPAGNAPETLDTPTRPATPPGGTNRDRDLDRNRDTDRNRSYYPGYGPFNMQGANQTTGNAPATLVVHLPADARLIIEGEPTRSTSDVRTFESPPLTPGKTYRYTLKAELRRGGENVETTKNVEVRAGQESQVFLEFPVRDNIKR